VATVGSKYSEFTASSRSALNSVHQRSVKADHDDQPLTLIDQLKSAPAGPIDIPSVALQKPIHHARCPLRRVRSG